MSKNAFNDDDWLITHSNCMDGAMCSVVFQQFGGTESNIIYSSPDHTKTDQALKDLLNSDNVNNIYLADVSISEDFAKQIDTRCNRVTVIDHHKSAIPLAKYKWCIIDKNNKQCGCLLFYHWCLENFEWTGMHCDDLRELCELADDRDRWINADPKSKDFHTLFSFLGQNKYVDRCMQPRPTELKTSEEYVIKIEQEKETDFINGFAKKMHACYIEDYYVGFGVCEKKYVSDLGNHLCNKEKFDFVVLMDYETISLRCGKNDKLDMSKIAKKYRGGGHAKAAGFTISNLLQSSLLDLVVNNFEISE